jgi:hypothetical protein
MGDSAGQLPKRIELLCLGQLALNLLKLVQRRFAVRDIACDFGKTD